MTVSSTTNKVSYSGNGTTTVFAYTFKIFADGDLDVYIRSSTGTETLKTLTTDYTVSNAGVVGGGNVTFVTAPASGETVVIQRKLALTQGTDYVENDPFPAESHEEALDRLTFITQQMQEEIDRSIKASVTNTISSTEFAISAADRANKIFAFDGSGDLSVTQELGTYQGNWAASTTYAARDLVKDTSTNNIFLANTAHTSSGSQPLTTNTDSAKWDLIVDAAAAASSATAAASSATAAASSATAAASSASAAATSESNASTSESNASTYATNASTAQTAAETAQTAAETAQAAAEAVFDNFDDAYLGAKATDPTVDNDGDALADGALYFDTTNNVMKVYDLGTTTWYQLTPTVSNQTNINTVAGIASDVTTTAGISSDITTTAGISSNITTVAGISANVTTVAGDSSNIGTIATDLTGSNTIGTVATNIADVGTVAGKATEIGLLGTADAVSDMNTLGTADAVSDMNTLAAISADITTLAHIEDGTTATNAIQTVAANVSDVNSFANTYFISATAPGSPTVGDLWFDTTNDIMKVYSSGGFINAGSAVNGTANRATFAVGTTEGSYTGSTTVFPIEYDAGYIDVYLNGIKLDPDNDFTATNGTSVTLSSAAATGDIVDMVGYGTFELANFAIGDANNVTITSVADNEVLAYDSGTSAWINQTAAEAGLATTAQIANSSNWDTAYGWGDHSTQNYATTTGDTMTGDLNFSDNVSAVFGTSSDFKIFHNGDNTYMNDLGTGNLYISTNGAEVSLRKVTGNEAMLIAKPDAEVELYYDDSLKFETTSTGVSVTGEVGLSGTGTWTVKDDGTGNLVFYASGTAKMKLDTSGNLTVTGNVTAYGTI